MVAIVSGNSLGLSFTSLATLGQRGTLGSSGQGRSGEQAFVNIANGNLVLQDFDDRLEGRGLDISAVRTYNSQGLLLNRVARSAGYDHWHHVVQCHKMTIGRRGAEALLAECTAIQEAERRGEVKVVMNGPDVGVGPFILFSTGIGDAWMLDPEDRGAACLVWRSEVRPPRITETPRHIEIGWDGSYELLGAFMQVTTEAEGIGSRAVAGYPLDLVRDVIDRALSFERKFAAVIAQEDALEMTQDVIAQVVRLGWDETKVREFAAEGYRYSPSRNTMLSPIVTSDDDPDNDDEGHNPPSAA